MLLNVKTCFSLLESVIKIPDYIKWGLNKQTPWLSVIDNNNLFGHINFYQACLQHNIKPILGIQGIASFENDLIKIALIARNASGYKLIMQIASQLQTDTKESLSWEDWCQAVRDNFVVIMLNEASANKAAQIKHDLQKLGLEWFWGITAVEDIKLYGSNIAAAKMVWFPEIYQFDASNDAAIKVLNNLRQSNHDDVKDSNAVNCALDQSPQLPAAIKNNQAYIATHCNLELQPFDFKDNFMIYKTPNQLPAATFLRQLCFDGLHNRVSQTNFDQYKKRLESELAVIADKHFEDYFLVVHDYVKAAKALGILVGPGRGSAAGSLVSYALGITDIDPIAYNLLFERFLSSERQSLPDIDVDIEDRYREKIIFYLVEKYGADHVAYINTFQTIGAKMAIRDVGRILGIDLSEINDICQLISDDLVKFKSADQNKHAILEYYMDHYPDLFAIARALIGLPRQPGTHAAGIIITQKPLDNYTPIMAGLEGVFKTQWDMYSLDYLGLVKMDILGLRNLSILHNICDEVSRKLNKKVQLLKIPLNNQRTFSLLRAGYTQGIFQLESAGMTNVLQLMQVNSLEDIVVTSSIYRPGPQSNIHQYIKLRNHEIPCPKWPPELNSILRPTNGIIIFQEQVMLIAVAYAGFSLAKADVLRRAMAKKDLAWMESAKADFFQGAQKLNHNVDQAQKIWSLIYKFASYGFNRSHAVAYSMIGYWMAFFKANYYPQFCTALLNSVIGGEYRSHSYLLEAQRFNMQINLPSVNHPQLVYTSHGNTLYLPLLIIKQIGPVFANYMCEDYRTNGPYQDIFNFFIRTYYKYLNKQTFYALCYSGALDCFGINRTMLYANYAVIANYIEVITITQKGKTSFQQSLAPQPNLLQRDSLAAEEMRAEGHCYGFYIKNHPVNYLRKKYALTSKTQLIKDVKPNQTCSLIGCITSVRTHSDSKGRQMCFLEVEDETSKINLVVFANQYEKYASIIKSNSFVMCLVRVQLYKDKLSCIVNEMETLT